MNEIEAWLRDNGRQCLQRENRTIISVKQCKHESAKKYSFMSGLCKKCTRYVKPDKETEDKVKLPTFGRYNGRGQKRNNI